MEHWLSSVKWAVTWKGLSPTSVLRDECGIEDWAPGCPSVVCSGARLRPFTLQPAAWSHRCEGSMWPMLSSKKKVSDKPKHSYNWFFSYLNIFYFPCLPLIAKKVMLKSSVKCLSHVVLSNLDKKTKPNQTSSLNKDAGILVTFPYNCNFQGSQTHTTTQAVLQRPNLTFTLKKFPFDKLIHTAYSFVWILHQLRKF